MKEIGQILLSYLADEQPFVAYRLPESREICLLKADSVEGFIFSGQNIFTETGFLIVPFDNENRQAYLLKGKKRQWAISNEPLMVNREPLPVVNYPLPADYKSAFAEIHAAICGGEISKAVLSRQHLVSNFTAVHAPASFLHLCQTQPSAFVYLLSLPDAGVWLGASPELFLRSDAQSIETVSLAGTKSARKSAKWTAKEADEQDIVTDFVTETIDKFNIQHIEKMPAATISAGQLAHLQTRFRFPRNELKKHIGDFIEALHPTPAVCGYPKGVSKQLIINSETHDRNLYAGFLGKIENNGNFDLYVNIRCMQILENNAIIYVGGGITAASCVQAEFDETVLKAENLIKMCKQNEKNNR